MTKSELREISNKLGWEVKDTANAVKEFCSSNSIIKCEEFLKICASAKDHESRFILVRNFLYEILTNRKFNIEMLPGEGTDYQKLRNHIVTTISDWLKETDPCFTAWAVFNAGEITDRRKIIITDTENPNYEFRLYDQKSFVKWHSWKRALQPLNRVGGWPYDPNLEPKELCDKFLDFLVSWIDQKKGFELTQLLPEVVAQTGFLAFNIEAFRQIASWYSFDPNLHKKEIELANILNNAVSIKNKQSLYWLYFVLTEKCKKKYGLRGSFRKISELLTTTPKTVSARYFEQKRKALKYFFVQKKIGNDSKFELDAIIRKFNLKKALDYHLAKADM